MSFVGISANRWYRYYIINSHAGRPIRCGGWSTSSLIYASHLAALMNIPLEFGMCPRFPACARVSSSIKPPERGSYILSEMQ
jgi:hypothetical protein